MSGSPIINSDDSSGKNAKVIGIHTAGAMNKETGRVENSGVYLNQSVI